MKDKKNFEAAWYPGPIALIGIVLGGRCPGVICPGGPSSWEEIVEMQLSGGSFPKWELSEG